MPLVRRAATTARSAFGGHVLTVLGHDCAAVFAAVDSESAFVVVNENYKSGLGSSIATAARACPESADGLVLMLADQLLVSPAHLRALVTKWSGARNEIVASSYAGTEGAPALFPKGTFEQLRSLDGDEGARALFGDARFRLSTVRFEPASTDIDTPADLATLT